jgi:hypothetical protein
MMKPLFAMPIFLMELGAEEVDPFAVGRLGDLFRITAIAGHERAIFADVRVNGLFVEDSVALPVPELVTGNLHGHGALVREFAMRFCLYALSVPETDPATLRKLGLIPERP